MQKHSFSALIFPSISLFVQPSMRGISFGLSLAVVNIGMFIYPFIFGFLIDLAKENKIRGYSYVSLMLICTGGVGLVTSVITQIRYKKILNQVSKKPKVSVLEAKNQRLEITADP